MTEPESLSGYVPRSLAEGLDAHRGYGPGGTPPGSVSAPDDRPEPADRADGTWDTDYDGDTAAERDRDRHAEYGWQGDW